MISISINLLFIVCFFAENSNSTESESELNARKMNSWLQIKGMTCNSCVNNIKSVVQTISGVLNIEIYLEDCKAFLTYDPKLTSDLIIAQRIDDMGFDCQVIDDGIHSNGIHFQSIEFQKQL